jgi:hypothetical protein
MVLATAKDLRERGDEPLVVVGESGRDPHVAGPEHGIVQRFDEDFPLLEPLRDLRRSRSGRMA